MRDLFESHLTRAQLLDIYVDTVTVMSGFPPSDHRLGQLGRAALVDRIERLADTARERRLAEIQNQREFY